MLGSDGRPGDPAYSACTRAFFAVAWTPKATVQAALSGTPLHLVRILKQGSADYEQWVTWGEQVGCSVARVIGLCWLAVSSQGFEVKESDGWRPPSASLTAHQAAAPPSNQPIRSKRRA